jgi:hypothetical protein
MIPVRASRAHLTETIDADVVPVEESGDEHENAPTGNCFLKQAQRLRLSICYFSRR